MHHVLLAHRAAAVHGRQAPAQAEFVADVAAQGRLADEGQAGRRPQPAMAAEHRPVVHRLRRRDAGVGVAHQGRGNEAALEHEAGLDAEEGRPPQHQVGPLADLDAADVVRDAVRDGRVDGVFGDIALDAEVVVAGVVCDRRTLTPALSLRGRGSKPAALALHLVRRLPGADDDFADAPHGLAVAGHDADGAEVVQDVLGGDGLAPDAALGEGQVLGDRRVEVMAHHQHVQVLVERVDGVGPRRVGARRQHVGLAHDLHDVGRVAAAGAFAVEGVDGAALEGRDAVLDEAALVERVGVDRDLRVGDLGHRQAVVDRGRRGAPVLVQLQADGAGGDLLAQRLGPAGVALAQETQVHREGFGCLQHAVDVLGPRRAGGGVGAGGRPRAAAEHGGDARIERLVDLLRADEVDVAVDAAGGDDQTFAGDDLGAGTDDDVDAGLGVGVAGLADGGDAAALQADVGLDDAPVVDDERVGDDAVAGLVRSGAVDDLALAHAVADGLAAAELDLLSIAAGTQRVVGLDLDDQAGVGQPQAVADGGAVHLGIGASA